MNRLFGRLQRMWEWRVIRMAVIRLLWGGTRLQGTSVGRRLMRDDFLRESWGWVAVSFSSFLFIIRIRKIA